MLKISTKGRYALRALIDLAMSSNDNMTTLKDIAERQSISVKYLESLFTLLCKSNILISKRGAKGGYSLAKDPSQLTVFEIISAVEDELRVVNCIDGTMKCSFYDTCKAKLVWKNINNDIMISFKNKTIADYL